MNTHITQSSHTIMVNEGIMDIPVPETLILQINTRIYSGTNNCNCHMKCVLAFCINIINSRP